MRWTPRGVRLQPEDRSIEIGHYGTLGAIKRITIKEKSNYYLCGLPIKRRVCLAGHAVPVERRLSSPVNRINAPSQDAPVRANVIPLGIMIHCWYQQAGAAVQMHSIILTSVLSNFKAIIHYGVFFIKLLWDLLRVCCNRKIIWKY